MDKYDVLVIGGGPGGYVAAARSAQLNHPAGWDTYLRVRDVTPSQSGPGGSASSKASRSSVLADTRSPSPDSLASVDRAMAKSRRRIASSAS